MTGQGKETECEEEGFQFTVLSSVHCLHCTYNVHTLKENRWHWFKAECRDFSVL